MDDNLDLRTGELRAEGEGLTLAGTVVPYGVETSIAGLFRETHRRRGHSAHWRALT